MPSIYIQILGYTVFRHMRGNRVDASDFQIKEYTINQEIDFILGDIFLEKPKMIGFSCYIWNIDIVAGISKEIHKIMPDVPIWLGGPEVSYDCDMQLKKYPWIKGIISGEGEVSFYELINHYLAETVGNIKVGLNIPGLSDIKGIVYREDAVASGVDNIVTNLRGRICLWMIFRFHIQKMQDLTLTLLKTE